MTGSTARASFDVIVIGAGSVGVPIALNLAEAGASVACIDSCASPGQGSNKCAIGGIRATHAEPAKVSICLESIEMFGTWEDRYGDDIEWRQGGYTFVAYDAEIAGLLKKMVPVQQAAGLSIDFFGPERIMELVPGIAREGLLGGTFSPGDGSASPMRSCHAFYRRAVELGAVFRFGETVTAFETDGDRIAAVRTGSGETISGGSVINCAGSSARELGALTGLDLPVIPDSHEAGVTEPVARFMEPMVVDIRKAPGSANYYFFQFATGQIIFCITPDPPILGTSTLETSEFLPMVAPRMVGLLPRLANIKVRRTWRGTYPQTPDGSPIVCQAGPDNHFLAVGMCGQGYMLGPGIGSLMARLVLGELNPEDERTLHALRLDRGFGAEEALK